MNNPENFENIHKDYGNYGLIPDKMRALRQQHEIETVMRLAS